MMNVSRIAIVLPLVFLVVGCRSEPGKKPPVRPYRDVALGEITRILQAKNPKDSKTFLCEPVLVLDPDLPDLEKVGSDVEGRREELRKRVRHLLESKSIFYLRKKGIEQLLEEEILKELNQFLKSADQTRDLLKGVHFTKFVLPL